tara:strand:- start:665 stop:1285 length:621 start_codon:yes stop_codon:yes gene_type:complete
MSEEIIWQANIIEVDYIYRVYFDPKTTVVMRVSSNYEADTDYPSFEVNYYDIEDIVSGAEPIANCKVFFNIKAKQYELVKNTIAPVIYTVSQEIYKCKKIKNADIQIIQDIKNTCWKILMSNELKYKLAAQRVSVTNIKDNQITFSVTAKNNPNILYRLLSFPFSDLLDDNYVVLDFKDQYEFDGLPISVYTIQKFDTYSYEMIHE